MNGQRNEWKYDAFGNRTNEFRYNWTGQFWLLRSENNLEYDAAGRTISSNYRRYQDREVDFELINRYGYEDDTRIYEYQEVRLPAEGTVDIDIRRGIWGKGEYIRESESFEFDELSSSAYFRTRFDSNGNRLEGYTKFYARDEPLREYRSTDYYNNDGCHIGTISTFNENGNGWQNSDSTRIVPIIGCQNKTENYYYTFENNAWILQDASRQESRFDANGNQTMYLEEKLIGQSWDTLYYELSTYNARGDIVEYYLDYPEARVRITYSYTNNYLTTSYLVEVDDKFFSNGFQVQDSIYVELNADEQLVRQAMFQRRNGAFVLYNEMINTYNQDKQVSTSEFFYRNLYQEERERTEYTYRCDGELLEIQRTITEASPVTTLGNQTLEQFYYMRNDDCSENTATGVTLYPNHADNYVGFDLPPGVNSMNLRVINSSGQVVRETVVNTASPYFRLDTSALSEGLYIIQIQSESHSASKRLVVNRG